MADNYYWLTSLGLNCEGTDGSTSFPDVSPTPKTVNSVNGNAQINTSTLLLDGSGDWIDYTSDAGYDFGTGDFCIELRWRPVSATIDYQLMMLAKTAGATAADLAFSIIHQGAGDSGKVTATIYNGTTGYTVKTTAGLAAATTYHIAFCRISGVLYLYLNGALQQTLVANVSVNTPTSRLLNIGRSNYSAGTPAYANGNMKLIRITKGDGRYPSQYTVSDDLFVATDPGTGDAALTAPIGVVTAYGAGTVALTAPKGTLLALSAGRAVLASPMGVLLVEGHDSTGERAFDGTAPMGALSALGGAGAALTGPMGTLMASVTVPVSVRANLIGPMGQLVSSATVSVSVHADLRLTSAGALVAYSGARATLEGPMGALQTAATVGALAHFTGTSPIGVLTARASAGIVVTARLAAPMPGFAPYVRALLVAPMGQLTATAAAVVAVTYEAYAVNLRHVPRRGVDPVDEVTRYTSYPFDRIVRYRDAYYGVSDSGVYLLEGLTDAGAAITWAFKTAMTDDAKPEKKTVRAARFGGRLGPAATVTLYSGEGGGAAYSYTTPRDAAPQNYRQKFGRGVKDRYYALGVSGTGVLALDTVEPEVDDLTRRL